MEAVKTSDKPALGHKWFWDMDYERIDWQASYKSIIARIVERGGPEHWEELIRFYGSEKVLKALKSEIVFLPDYAIEKVSAHFGIEKVEMLCYMRKRSKKELLVQATSRTMPAALECSKSSTNKAPYFNRTLMALLILGAHQLAPKILPYPASPSILTILDKRISPPSDPVSFMPRWSSCLSSFGLSISKSISQI